MIAFELHKKALDAVQRYTRAESDLIEILQKIDECRGYLNFGWKSLFEYTHHGLGLSESVTFNLITVARKAREVPALHEMIRAREITLSNARTIAPLLTPDNQSEWLSAASSLSKRELERKIDEQSPIPKKRILELRLSEELQTLLERARELIEQRRGRPVALEETLSIVTESYVRRNDPVLKAERAVSKSPGSKPENSKSLNAGLKKSGPENCANPSGDSIPVPGQAVEEDCAPVSPEHSASRRTSRSIPASIRHEVHRRDGGRCTFINPRGKRCQDRRWIDIHHKVPCFAGGKTELSNLTTLCRGHHQMVHAYTGLSQATDERHLDQVMD